MAKGGIAVLVTLYLAVTKPIEAIESVEKVPAGTTNRQPGVEALSIVAPAEQTEVHAGIARARRSSLGVIVSC
jgi:hypothetical protein